VRFRAPTALCVGMVPCRGHNRCDAARVTPVIQVIESKHVAWRPRRVCPFLDDDVLWTLAVDTVVVQPRLVNV
jgi:hypothetical protein